MMVVVGSYPSSSQAPTHVEVELGCDDCVHSYLFLFGSVSREKENIFKVSNFAATICPLVIHSYLR